MKPQDILFFIILIFLIAQKKPRLAVFAGIASLFLSIPLFSLWIFFTAERLVWYAAAFFTLFIALTILKINKNDE